MINLFFQSEYIWDYEMFLCNKFTFLLIYYHKFLNHISLCFGDIDKFFNESIGKSHIHIIVI